MATRKLWKAFSRKRDNCESDDKSELARVLGIFDLTALGVGSTLGLGVYVLAGRVAKETAGPAVCISFLIAAVASAFAGMCYAEFASRVPKAGSAYAYSYVTVGEFIAFVIGWNLILEYVLATASMARGLSDYIDSLLGNVMRDYLQAIMPIKVSFLSEYPDFFAFVMVILLIALLCIGVQESSYLNIGLTFVNLLTIVIIVVAGSIKADPRNWNLSLEDIPSTAENPGTGGFFPFGVRGVMVGAAKCFFGFVGFDAVASTGEEAKNPQRTIPIAILISLSIICASYFSISTVLTMMWPYYDQNPQAPFPYVFEQIGWPAVMWIVNIGAIFALCTNLLGSMFPLPRVLYAMASDGIIFKFLAKIHPKTQTPVIGTIVSGLLTAAMTLIFNLKQLIDMMSIGTLLAYTIVAISVLILRYKKEDYKTKVVSNAILANNNLTTMHYFKQMFNLYNLKEPTYFSSAVASWGILIFSIIVVIFGFILNNMGSDLIAENTLIYVVLAILGLLMLWIVIAIARQPVQPADLPFKVPLVPIIPCLSILINLYLMLQLDSFTWMRFAVWMTIGFAIYFCYGISHSLQGHKNKIAPSEPVKMVTKFQSSS